MKRYVVLLTGFLLFSLGASANNSSFSSLEETLTLNMHDAYDYDYCSADFVQASEIAVSEITAASSVASLSEILLDTPVLFPSHNKGYIGESNSPPRKWVHFRSREYVRYEHLK